MTHREDLDMAQVLETDRPSDVNLLLRAGWRLITTYVRAVSHQSQEAIYVLGWPRAAGEVVNPIGERHAKLYDEYVARRDAEAD